MTHAFEFLSGLLWGWMLTIFFLRRRRAPDAYTYARVVAIVPAEEDHELDELRRMAGLEKR